MEELTGRVALVTGGGRGLGEAVCHALAQAGAIAIPADIQAEAAVRVAAAIAGPGKESLNIELDVTDERQAERAVARVVSRFGRLDVLINNAGLSPLAPSALEHSEELFDKIIGVNLKGPFRLSALFGSRMAAAEGGAIINITSNAAIRPDSDMAVYGAAKAGLNVLTQTFAQEYGPKVRVNCIMCGPFHTDISKGWSRTAAYTQRAKETFPLQRAGDPEEVAGAALYFASPAASFTTGSILTIDGGVSNPLSRTVYENPPH